MLIPFVTFLCWGSFLNVCAYRLIMGGSLWSRSACPHCTKPIKWQYLIPIVSWIALEGKCRICKQPISKLYPFIELLTALICTVLLYITYPPYFLSYFILTTALIITIRTDLEFMLIPRLCSIYLVPVGIILSICNVLPISWHESMIGSLIGYSILAIVSYLYKKRTGITGMGEGDPELLAGIGSFVGINGVWYTLLIGSLSATVYALGLMAFDRATSDTKIPFGPFLALGALAFVLLIS